MKNMAMCTCLLKMNIQCHLETFCWVPLMCILKLLTRREFQGKFGILHDSSTKLRVRYGHITKMIGNLLEFDPEHVQNLTKRLPRSSSSFLFARTESGCNRMRTTSVIQNQTELENYEMFIKLTVWWFAFPFRVLEFRFSENSTAFIGVTQTSNDGD